MAKKQTKTNPCLSGYGGGEKIWISQAHYIAEIVCKNVAFKNQKILGVKFWETAEWKPIFQRQLILARSLLKIHPFPLILRVLNLKSGHLIYSLAAPQLDKLLEQEERVPVQVDIPELISKDARPVFTPKTNKFARLE